TNAESIAAWSGTGSVWNDTVRRFYARADSRTVSAWASSRHRARLPPGLPARRASNSVAALGACGLAAIGASPCPRRSDRVANGAGSRSVDRRTHIGYDRTLSEYRPLRSFFRPGFIDDPIRPYTAARAGLALWSRRGTVLSAPDR